MSQLVLARDGTPLHLTLSGDDRYRLWTPLEDIPAVMIEATLLQEDRHFYRHPGLNPWSLLRAAHQTYVRGGRRIGGSTLTMQVARLRFGLDTRTWHGKLAQMMTALALELRYPKRDLLEAYLNLAPYGGNVEGIGAASLVWLGKPAADLTPAEAFTLAVIPKSPAARAPFTAAGRAQIGAARERLAARARMPLDASAVHLRARNELPFTAPHLVERLVAERPFTARISSTIDPRLQAIVEQQVRHWRDVARTVGADNAAVLLADHTSGEVLAYVGSADHADARIDGAVDGVRARRSPGSALKPFLYGLALDGGLINPETMLEDTSLTISSWNPENFDHDFVGPISATDALVRSRNMPAVQLANRLPAPGLYGFLARAGIGGLRGPDFYGLALALGGVEVRLDELVRLYALLATGGVEHPLVFVRGEADTTAPRLLSTEAAFLVLDMLRANPRPGDEASARRRTNVAWKTGTSFGFRDAWAAGVAGRFVLGVWVGNFDGAPNPAFVGRETAGPLFFRVLDALAAAGEALAPPTPPPGLRRASLCALSGAVAGTDCPGHKEGWVIPGRSPVASCSVHRRVALDVGTGLRACPGQIEGVRTEVFEFWPSHLQALFRRVGVPRRTPPPYDPRCTSRAGGGRPLRIETPQARVVYALRDGEDDTIPFSAVADADGRRISWFVDDAFVGQSAPGETFFWQARPGRFVVRAVDEMGRSLTETLGVELLSDGRTPRVGG